MGHGVGFRSQAVRLPQNVFGIQFSEGGGSRSTLVRRPASLAPTPVLLASGRILRPHPPYSVGARKPFDSLKMFLEFNGGRGRESNPPIPPLRRQTGFE